MVKKETFLEHLLSEVMIDVDPNDPDVITDVRKKIIKAQRNPDRAAREQILKSKENITDARAGDSPTKELDIKIARTKQNLANLEKRRIDQEERAERATVESTITPDDICEVIYLDENDQIIHEGFLTEAILRQFKRYGTVLKKQYRCLTGRKKGKIVANPNACAQRKDPKKVRHGRKVAKKKKGIRVMKTRIAKNKSISKLVTRLNKRLKGI